MPHALVMSFVVVVSYITIQYYYCENFFINTIKHLSTFTCFAALEESICITMVSVV